MNKLSVIYHSVSGTTHQLAQAIVEGAAITGIQVNAIRIQSEDINNGRYTNLDVLNALEEADGVIFGSPTFMGSVSAQFKAFADASSELWMHQALKNKLAAGFTIGIELSGDQLSTLQYMQILAAQHGMLWAGLDKSPGNRPHNRLGAHTGLIAQTSGQQIHPTDLHTARYLGERIATLIITRKTPGKPVISPSEDKS